ncbi:ArnT family glycosyltransferase [Duganella callida]|uniref:Phospholipid carrier-dependent glycosyltransferase n=1 Tax=Duganella callida TaxID=2561932 RepID=A0A4Y9SHH2_9BURK|nr:glycosyltransferase family 39 protein [Duganella callida]TFW24326.1 phospholipid carrier-dependent glycosyltransferase [Duganella callida]
MSLARRWRAAAALAAIAALALYYFHSAPTDGDFWWYDASRHAMNGVFLRDFLLDGGLRDPFQFARDYYQRYPAVNVGFYPPLFYLSAVPLLVLLGASHAVAQAMVSLYALLAGAMAWLLLRRQLGPLTAGAAVLALLSLAPFALWSRQVQLDVPAIAVLLASSWALTRYTEQGGRKWLYLSAVLLGCAMLTRVQAVFAVPVMGYFLFLHRQPAPAPLRQRLIALALMGCVAAPAVLMAAYFARVNQTLATAVPGMPGLWTFENWTWYVRCLPQQFGWPCIALVLAGLAGIVRAAWQRRLPPPALVLLAFTVCAWVFFTVVSNKDSRFNLPGIAFLFLTAAYGLSLLGARLASLALPALALWQLVQLALMPPVPFVAGFKQAAQVAAQLTPARRNVLISAHRDGSFIFDLRTATTRADIGVRRADKLLVEIAIMRGIGIRDSGLGKPEIVRLLERNRIDTIVAQPGYLADQPAMDAFESMLRDGTPFRLVRVIPMSGKLDKPEKELLVYSRSAR